MSLESIHDFRPGTVAETSAATVSILPPKARFSLRLLPEAIKTASKILGADLPEKIGARTSADGLEVLRLGPDEWVLLCDESKRSEIETAFASIYNDCSHSLVDISDREVTVEITGDKATDLLTLGWPRDPASIPVGEARRTVFDGATVVIWRDGENAWRLNGWRSFMPHLLELLATGCRELAAE